VVVPSDDAGVCLEVLWRKKRDSEVACGAFVEKKKK
jgi:hypothetical protein